MKIPTKSDTRFPPRETPSDQASSTEPYGHGGRAVGGTDVLRKRLQYAWDEIAHLSRTIKETQADAVDRMKQGHEELAALRVQIDTLHEALAAKSKELDSRVEERELLGSHIHRLLSGQAKTRAELEQTTSSLRNLRQSVARMQLRTNALTVELARKEAECRRLQMDANQRPATLHAEEVPPKPPSAAPIPAVAAPATDPADFEPAIPISAENVALHVPEPPAPEPAEPVLTAPAVSDPVLRPASPEAFLATMYDQSPVTTEQIQPLWVPGERRGLLTAPRSLIILGLLVPLLGYFLWSTFNPDSEAQRSALVPASSPTSAPVLDQPVIENAASHMTPVLPPEATQQMTLAPPPEATQHRPPAPVRDRLHGGGFGPDLVKTGPDTFIMGNTSLTAAPSEVPTREVRIDQFLLSTTEVTFADYDRFARATGAPMPNDFGWGRGKQPVIGVSWDDAQAYTQWLSQQTGHRYRLPTEAEWEYAARGGIERNYWWGTGKGTGNAVCFDCGSPWDNRMTAPVASLPANPYGLYDTAGNAMEWVADCWLPDYTDAPTDAQARTTGDCQSRVARGGAFNKPATSMRSQSRHQFAPNTRINMLGFRVARDR